MASGVNVADGVLDTFTEMKLSKNDGDRIRITTFRIQNKHIDVELVIREKDLEKDAFQTFMDLLEPTVCRYLLYDCHYETTESVKEEIVFAMWCPSTGIAAEKMNYASSRDAIKKKLSGIKHSLQLNDYTDCSGRNSFAENLGKTVISVEGTEVSVPN